jgi:hypothetical protein
MSENDPFDGPAIGRITVRPVPVTGVESSLLVTRALQSSVEYLLGLQNPEGFWVGELEADSSLESDAILLDYFLGNPQPERIRKLANCIREQQSADGGWQLYPGGPPNVSLPRAAPGWRRRKRSGTAQSRAPGAGTGRRRSHQQLHQDLSVPARAV